MKHKHHIIPKHEGGTDNPENIVHLTVPEHAEAHRELYEKNGKIEDYLAWKGLSGIIGKEEIIKELMIANGKMCGNNSYLKKIGIHDPAYINSDGYKKICSDNGKKIGNMMAESGHCKRIAPLGGGKNLGKKYWYNQLTGKETVSFDSPGDHWIEGINMERIDLEWLRNNSDNVKGTFWVTNKETGDTKMIHAGESIPDGFSKGRSFKTENIMDLHNSPSEMIIDGIEQVENIHSFIIFNQKSMRWELIPKKNSKRIIKVSHTDYYGLVWLRDIIIEKYSLNYKKSIFDFNSCDNLEDLINLLKGWREYIKISKILETKKLKKWRKEDYSKKLESLYIGYILIESIRSKIIPSL